LAWIGTLIRLAMGLASFLASSLASSAIAGYAASNTVIPVKTQLITVIFNLRFITFISSVNTLSKGGGNPVSYQKILDSFPDIDTEK
jgi:hypothetical protein